MVLKHFILDNSLWPFLRVSVDTVFHFINSLPVLFCMLVSSHGRHAGFDYMQFIEIIYIIYIPRAQ